MSRKTITVYRIVIPVLVVCLSALTISYAHTVISTRGLPLAGKLIYLDAGHGGMDPGKPGTNGADEKDINLAIALKLQAYLEIGGAQVVVTRLEDEGLYTEQDQNKKRAAMQKRRDLFNESGADLMVSIHQNSFPESQYWGPQVFYQENSEEAKRLATEIQDQLNSFTSPDNTRVIKQNDSYYILKQSEIPAVLVECGFLTNSKEEESLNDESYQKKVAWGIYAGIAAYFNIEAGNCPSGEESSSP